MYKIIANRALKVLGVILMIYLLIGKNKICLYTRLRIKLKIEVPKLYKDVESKEGKKNGNSRKYIQGENFIPQ